MKRALPPETGISRSEAIRPERIQSMKNYFGDTSRYEEIMRLPHPVSKTHPQMPREDRAAQFAPFAALTGYGDAIKETGRLTEEKRLPDEERMEILDRTVSFLKEQIKKQPLITVTCFQADERKSGGAYRTVGGRLKRFDDYRRSLVMTDGTEIFFDDILEIYCGDEAEMERKEEKYGRDQ